MIWKVHMKGIILSAMWQVSRQMSTGQNQSDEVSRVKNLHDLFITTVWI